MFPFSVADLSCMDDCEDLEQSLPKSSSQYLDCKTCCVCDGADNAVSEQLLKHVTDADDNSVAINYKDSIKKTQLKFGFYSSSV